MIIGIIILIMAVIMCYCTEYSFGLLNWMESKIKSIRLKRTKLLSVHQAVHSRVDFHRLCVI